MTGDLKTFVMECLMKNNVRGDNNININADNLEVTAENLPIQESLE